MQSKWKDTYIYIYIFFLMYIYIYSTYYIHMFFYLAIPNIHKFIWFPHPIFQLRQTPGFGLVHQKIRPFQGLILDIPAWMSQEVTKWVISPTYNWGYSLGLFHLLILTIDPITSFPGHPTWFSAQALLCILVKWMVWWPTGWMNR